MINVSKLHQELVTAGIPIDGCASTGRIDFRPEATDEQKAQAKVILENHNPVWWLEERKKAYPSISDQIDIIYKTFKVLKSNNITLGTEGDNWIAVIDKIKADYPKE